MKDLTIKIPDNFTEAQIAFIKKSAFLQIESEIKKTLSIPKAEIDAANLKVEEIKTAMGITTEE